LGLGKDINRESLALTAATGELGGTPGYCAPEQWFTLEDIIDGRFDIFSLGVIFYEMMTGRRSLVFDENDIMMKKKIRIDPTFKILSNNFSQIGSLHFEDDRFKT
jgi:serine/threonine protein kinase